MTVLLVGVCAFSGSACAKNDLDESTARGKVLAETHCAKCHAVGAIGESPIEGAPHFRDFSAKWPLESLAESLAEGIVTGHDKMPEFVFTPAEIDDFLNYLHGINAK